MLKGKELRSFEDSKYIGSLCFAPDSESFLTGSENEIRHWDIATGRLKRSFKNFSSLEREDVSSICFSPDERYFLSGGEYVSIKLWDFIAGEEVRSIDTIDPKHSRFYRLSVSPDGKYVLSGSFDLELWDLSSGKNIKTLERGSYAVASVSFSPNGKLAISGRRDA